MGKTADTLHCAAEKDGAGTAQGKTLLNRCALVAALALLLLLCACETKKEVLVNGGGVRAESFMWCTLTSFDGKWGLPGGVLLKASVNPPQNRSNIVMSAQPFPSEFKVSWFHFGQQKFYEAKLTDPSLREKAYDFVKRHEASSYTKRLLVCIYDSGKVEFWFGLASEPTREKKYIEFLASTQGYEVEGDPSQWKAQTEHGIKHGWMPAPALEKKEE